MAVFKKGQAGGAAVAVTPALVAHLQKVGLVLVIYALLDLLVFMVNLFYSLDSSANIYGILPLVFGVLLYQGRVSVVRVVWWGAAAIIGSTAGFLVMAPSLFSWGYLSAMFHVSPGVFLYALFYSVASFAVACWVYFQLREDVVLEVRRSAGMSVRRPYFVFVFSFLFVLPFSMYLRAYNSGADSQAIRSAVDENYGTVFDYFVYRIEERPEGVFVIMNVYNDGGMATVKGQCESGEDGVLSRCALTPVVE